MTETGTPRVPQGSPGYVDPRVERTRAAALDAAREVLVAEGWDAVTHVRVSERSGVGRATLYRHWPDQAALLAAALPQVAALSHVEPTGQLRTDLATELNDLRVRFEDPDAIRVLSALVDRAGWDDELDGIKVAVVDEHVAPLAGVLADGVERGDLRRDLDVRLAVGLLIGPLMFRRLLSGEQTSAAFVDAVIDTFLDSAASPATSSPAKRSIGRQRVRRR